MQTRSIRCHRCRKLQPHIKVTDTSGTYWVCDRCGYRHYVPDATPDTTDTPMFASVERR